MKKHTTLFFLLFCFGTFAKNYYVSSLGNDLNSGTITAPWKSIDKVNTMMNSFLFGDSILFKRGELFNGCLNVTCSSIYSLEPIVFSAYGTALTEPIITGSLAVTNWVLTKNNIWRAYHNNNSNYRITGLYINGKASEIGRYPNRVPLTNGNGMNGWSTITGKIGDSIIVDKNLTNTIDFTGATVVFKPIFYDMTSFDKITRTGTQIYFRAHSTFDLGSGYLLTNNINTLDVQGEWYHDAIKDSIYLFSTINPNSLTIRATNQNRLLQANSVKNLVFSKLGFYESQDTVTTAFSNKAALCFNSPNNVKMDQCVFRNHGGRVLCASTATGLGFSITNSLFEDNNGTSIRAQMGSNYLIKNNVIRRNSLISSQWKLDDTGIVISTLSNATVTENLIDSVGHNGIYAWSTTNSSIFKNLISHYNLMIGDAAGIYTHYKHTALDIYENIISDGGDGNEGSNLAKRLKTRSVYFDAQSDGMICHDNTFYSSGDAGVFIQSNTKNVKVFRNTIYDCDYNFYGISMRSETIDTAQISNDSVYNNIIFNKNTGYSIRNKKSTQRMGMVDNNYYCMPYQKEPLFLRLEKSIPYTQWVDSTLDKHSIVPSFRLDSLKQPASEYILFLVNRNKVDQTFSLGNTLYTDVKGAKYSGSVVIKPYASLILVKTGIATLLSGTMNELIKIYPSAHSGFFNVTVPEEKQYTLEVRNMLGQNILKFNNVSNQLLDMHQLNKGAYLAVFSDGMKITTIKFTVN